MQRIQRMQLRAATIGWIDRTWPVAFGAGACALVVALFLWEPEGSGLFPDCPFHARTGLHCPGCGSLRAMHQLLHGHLWAAFRLNPLMVLSLPLVALAVSSAHWPHLRFGWVERIASHPAWPLAILAIVLLYWLLRNLPYEPFSWLAPYRV
jgi:hypothetical protein